jgi:hypothetical protein
MRALPRILVSSIVAVLIGVPVALAAMADPFGAPEVSDPKWWPSEFASPILRADADGHAYWLSFIRNEDGDDQVAVYERCGGTTWTPTLIGTPADNLYVVGMQVAANGTAMVLWSVSTSQSTTFYSAVRPPGGAWGAPQTVLQDAEVSSIQFALSDSGAAVAVWADSSPAGTFAKVRPADGEWGAVETVTGTARDHDVAMSASGDAIVLFRDDYPGVIRSSFRPVGGPWGAPQEVLKNGYPDTLKQLMVEFDGLGRAVAMANFREFVDTVRVNVRTGGVWGSTDPDHTVRDFATTHDLRGIHALARHKDGAVAAWIRVPTSSNPNSELVVSRLSAGGWDTPHAFAVKRVYHAAAVANSAGEILVTSSVSGTFSDVRAAVVPSLTAAWPADLTRVSPEPSAQADYRGQATAAASGTAFFVGWGVHRGNNERSEVIATRPAATCGTASPTPTPTPTPTPNPLPAPPGGGGDPSPQPNPLPLQTTATGPSAIADFTSLPAASKCVRNRKLTVRFKKPPKGYAVKSITVRVNKKKVATIKGAKLKKPLYLRKLPKGSFTVTVSIKLKKGKGLTERRRYTACK